MPPANAQLPDPTTDPVLASYDNYLAAQEASTCGWWSKSSGGCRGVALLVADC